MKRRYAICLLIALCILFIPVAANTGYTQQTGDTITGQGTTDTLIRNAVDMTALENKYPHYHLTESSKNDSTVIAGDGSGVLRLYYERNRNTISYVYSGTTDETPPALPSSQTGVWDYDYTTAAAPSMPGYNFSGWTSSDTTVSGTSFKMPDAPVTLTGIWTPSPDTAYTVEYYQQNINDDNYTLVTADTIHSTGTTGSTIQGAEKSYPGFTITAASTVDIANTVIHSTGDTVLKLYYDRQSAQVSYVYSGTTSTTPPTIPAAQSYRFGSTVTVEEAPVLTGYQFSGWETVDTIITGGSFTIGVNDVTITGAWVPRTDTVYKVEHYQQNIDNDEYTLFDTDNLTGTTDAAASYTKRTFDGFKDASDVTPTTISPNGDTIIKLYYDRKTATVTYKYNGTTSITPPELPSSTTYKYGATVTIAPTVTLNGYTFSGWDKTESFSMPDSNVIITGTWSPKTDTPYTVDHYKQNVADDEYTLEKTDYLTGTTDASATFTKKTYTGFNTATDPAAATISPNGDTVIKLYYDRKIAEVSYKYNGVTTITPPELPITKSYKFGADVTVASTVTLQGYDFSGWDETGTITMGEEDVVISGTWTPKTDTPYSVEHYQQNINDDAYTLEKTDHLTGTTDVVASYTKQTYEGFKEAADAVTVNISPNGDAVVKLYYDRVTPKLTYKYEGTTSITPPALPTEQTYKYGATVTTAEAPSLTGYDFSGWDSDATFTMPMTDKVITGTWTPKTDTKYVVEHYKQNIDDDEYSLGDKESLTGTTDTNAIYTERTYAGFKIVPGTVETNISPNGDSVVKVYYDRLTSTVSYKYEGITSIPAPELPAPVTYRFGYVATTAEAPTLVGYTFSGWDKSSTFNVDVDDIVITGTWTPKSDTAYKEEYYKEIPITGDYELVDTVNKTGTTDSSVSIDDRSYEGYHVNETAEGSLLTSTVIPDGSLVLKKYFDINASKVTFDGNGGVVTGDISNFNAFNNTPYGTLPTVTKDGFKFSGWFTELDGGTEVKETTLCTNIQDHTLYAHWIVVVPDGGTVGGVVVDKNDKPIPNAKVSIKAGNEIYLSTVTDASGDFLIQGVNNGSYNLVAEKEPIITTTLITVASDSLKYKLTIPDEKTDSIVIVESGAPNTVIGGLDDLYKNESFYTAEDKATVGAGGGVKVTLTVNKTTDADKATVDKIKEEAKAGTVGLFINVNVDKTVTNAAGISTNTSIKELPQLIEIIVPLEASQQNMSSYTVYRNHEGSVDKIEKTPNEAGEFCKLSADGKFLIVSVSKFSTYCITYVIPVHSGGGGSSGSSSSNVTITTPDKYPSDVKNDFWASKEIDYVIDKGFMEVSDSNKFNPNTPITRAETTFAFSGIHNIDLSKYKNTDKFKDVTDKTKYAPSIMWANSVGYVLGYKDGRFGPNDSLTREQFAVMLYRQYGNGKTGTEWASSAFTDINLTTPRWSVEGLRWAVSNGILNGTKEGKLNPKSPITRAQAAALLMRVDKLYNAVK